MNPYVKAFCQDLNATKRNSLSDRAIAWRTYMLTVCVRNKHNLMTYSIQAITDLNSHSWWPMGYKRKFTQAELNVISKHYYDSFVVELTKAGHTIL